MWAFGLRAIAARAKAGAGGGVRGEAGGLEAGSGLRDLGTTLAVTKAAGKFLRKRSVRLSQDGGSYVPLREPGDLLMWVGPGSFARHVIDTHFEPSFLGLHGIL